MLLCLREPRRVFFRGRALAVWERDNANDDGRGALFCLPALAAAQVPAKLGYPGRLLKSDGTAESGVLAIKFAIFSSTAGGTALWFEEQDLALADGFYATALGETVSLPADLFDGSARHLEVSVAGTALSPRSQVGAVAYALLAQGLKGGAVDATRVSVNGTPVIDSSGKWVGSTSGLQGPKGDPGEKGDRGDQGFKGD